MSIITVYNYKHVNVGNLMLRTDTFVLDIMFSHGSIVGNPFYNRNDLTRTQKIDQFRVWFAEQLIINVRVQELMHHMVKLYTQNINIALICACKPEACHGDVLKAWIESAVGGIL